MTYNRPAYEQVMIAHGGNTVTLRPSLRAATILEASVGFPAMFKALDEGSFTIVSEIIVTACHSGHDAAAFLSSFAGKPLSPFFAAVQQPVAELVLMLQPAPAQPLRNTKPNAITNPGKAGTWPDFYADLYDKATGWLGWTPDAARNATPTEIDRAYWAFVARSRWLDGSDDKDSKQETPNQAGSNAEAVDPHLDRNALETLRGSIMRAGR